MDITGTADAYSRARQLTNCKNHFPTRLSYVPVWFMNDITYEPEPSFAVATCLEDTLGAESSA